MAAMGATEIDGGAQGRTAVLEPKGPMRLVLSLQGDRDAMTTPAWAFEHRPLRNTRRPADSH